MTATVASAGMLIRRPVSEVFEAFVDPATTARFWFSDGSGRLEPDARLRWNWAMYGAGTDVVVKAMEPGRRILIDWDVDSEPTEVEWTFAARGEETWVEVFNRGFPGAPEEQVVKALDSTGGFPSCSPEPRSGWSTGSSPASSSTAIPTPGSRAGRRHDRPR